MNAETAKKILLLYRAGTADADDPEFAEALDFVRQDDGLRHWFNDQCTAREMIRLRFKQIPVPEGLKEQIISERPWKTLVVSAREVVALGAFLGIAILLGIVLLWSQPHPPPDHLLAFEKRMVSTALRTYGMDLTTNDLNQIRIYLAEHHAHADYVLPAGLSKATPVGCALTTWQGQPVTMICFKTGRPMSPGQASDLWLFVIDHSALPGSQINEAPQVATVNRVTTASWVRDEKTYVLAAEGNEDLLRSYF